MNNNPISNLETDIVMSDEQKADHLSESRREEYVRIEEIYETQASTIKKDFEQKRGKSEAEIYVLQLEARKKAFFEQLEAEKDEAIAKLEAEYEKKMDDFEDSIGLYEAQNAAFEAEVKLKKDKHLALTDLRTKTDLLHDQAYEAQCAAVEEQMKICWISTCRKSYTPSQVRHCEDCSPSAADPSTAESKECSEHDQQIEVEPASASALVQARQLQNQYGHGHDCKLSLCVICDEAWLCETHHLKSDLYLSPDFPWTNSIALRPFLRRYRGSKPNAELLPDVFEDLRGWLERTGNEFDVQEFSYEDSSERKRYNNKVAGQGWEAHNKTCRLIGSMYGSSADDLCLIEPDSSVADIAGALCGHTCESWSNPKTGMMFWQKIRCVLFALWEAEVDELLKISAKTDEEILDFQESSGHFYNNVSMYGPFVDVHLEPAHFREYCQSLQNWKEKAKDFDKKFHLSKCYRDVDSKNKKTCGYWANDHLLKHHSKQQLAQMFCGKIIPKAQRKKYKCQSCARLCCKTCLIKCRNCVEILIRYSKKFGEGSHGYKSVPGYCGVCHSKKEIEVGCVRDDQCCGNSEYLLDDLDDSDSDDDEYF